MSSSKQFTLNIPIRGYLTISINSKDAQEAINYFLQNQDEILKHPYSNNLEPLLDAILIYETNLKYDS